MFNNRKIHNILVTGGAGFIGCNFIHFLLDDIGFNGRIINVDKITCKDNLPQLKQFEKHHNYQFKHMDICDQKAMSKLFKFYDIDTVVHFAAESHVDKSIRSPGLFLNTNIIGTYSLLNAAYSYWKKPDGSIRDDVLFHHISTDEVYGSLGNSGVFTESSPYNPRSPYSAAKASSDFIVMAYYYTYGLPVTVSNCSNNYGKYQFIDKFIPKMTVNIKYGMPLPIYGDGTNIRDWIHVTDHNRAVWQIIMKGVVGEKYNIGGNNEISNIDLLHKIIKFVPSNIDRDQIYHNIKFVEDRKGHDFRYSVDCSKLKQQLDWKPVINFEQGLEDTINWYFSRY